MFRNSALSGNGGAFVALQIRSLSLLNATADENKADYSCGVFCLERVGKFEMSGEFTQNIAKNSEGGICRIEEVETASITGIFEDNEADKRGGAMVLIK